jgi:predicted  nucleic acid-binding Zn-ribbon protein
MSAVELVGVHDLDLLARELESPEGRARLRKLGFEPADSAALAEARAALADGVDRRWLGPYERARLRYGRGLAAVRERVCLGCFVTLPTSVTPRGDAPALTVCESCARVLFWT